MAESTPKHGHAPIPMRLVDGPAEKGRIGALEQPGDFYFEQDGDPIRPTLSPSLHVVGEWHGWVRNGELVEA